jgi:hypothetical protein
MAPVSEGSEQGHEVTVTWNGAPARAWNPHLLTSYDFEVSVRTARRTEQAIAAVRASGVAATRVKPLPLLLLRAESVVSS